MSGTTEHLAAHDGHLAAIDETLKSIDEALTALRETNDYQQRHLRALDDRIYAHEQHEGITIDAS